MAEMAGDALHRRCREEGVVVDGLVLTNSAPIMPRPGLVVGYVGWPSRCCACHDDAGRDTGRSAGRWGPCQRPVGQSWAAAALRAASAEAVKRGDA
jgi:hypothetical protein